MTVRADPVDAVEGDPADAPTGGSASPRGVWHPGVSAAAAIAAGVSLWLSFPGHDLWPGAPVGVALLALAARGHRPRRAAWLGLLCGWASFVPLLSWSGVYVGRLPWFALATLEALYVAVMAAMLPAAWRVGRGRWAPAGFVVTVSGLWVLQEALRSRTPFGGFPWARLAFSQADSPLLGLAPLGGAPLLTAGVAAVGGCLALAAAAVPRPRGVVGGLGAAVALALAPLLVPMPVTAGAPGTPGGTLEVAAVQGNVPRAGLDFNAERRAVLDNHARATTELAQQVRAGRAPKPALVVWPENSSDIDPLRNADASAAIQAAVDTIEAPVLVGAVLEEPVGHLSNATLVWVPTGSPEPGAGERYVKRHPAPFGEYIPYRSFFRRFSDKVDLVRSDFIGGDRVGVLDAAGTRVGAVICFEVAYDDLVRDAVRSGGRILTVQTNNATFGFTDESVQQLAMSRVRAAETGRAVIHISTVGVSALIAPDGTIVRRSGHYTGEVLQAALPLREGLTPAVRLGAWPEAVLSVLALALLVGARRAARRDPAGRGVGRR